jgi:uncharacterized damage-inducible protein DinB
VPVAPSPQRQLEEITVTDRSFERANDESRERLARLIATLTPAQLAVDVGGGWTVQSVLAHVGFFDRFQAERWTQILAGTWSADDDSVVAAEHLALEALDPYWAEMDSQDIPNLALEAAARLDALIASAPDATVDAIEGGVAAYLLHRHRHRGEHLDQIERALAAATALRRPVDRSYLERNRASRERLRDVVGRLTRADLARPTDPSDQSSWTVGQALGHVAFWDRFTASRWRGAVAAGPGHQPIWAPDELADLLNSGLEPFLAAFADGSGAGLLGEVLAAADAVDGLIASLPDEAPLAAVLAERPRMLDRSVHRTAHLDDIERLTE